LFATATAIARELSYASLGTFRWRKWSFRFPTLGRTALALSNIIVVLVLCFYRLDTSDAWSWEDIGYRTGFVSIAQLPLIVLLAGKDNIIGLLTGFGYERLNWLHRWTARTLWLSATLHMGFWFRNWARYNYIMVKLKTDPLTQRGFAAWCILTLIVVTSVAPVRKLRYEVFVISHLITFVGFIAAIWLHAPDEVKVWVWLPIAFFALDRLLRGSRVLYLNLPPFHFWKRNVDGLWAHSAVFTPLSGGVTRLSIEKPAFTWKPGQHVFLSCHSIIPLQSHPFTIASLPSDGRLEFLVKAHRGGTKELLDHAIKIDTLPVTNSNPRSSSRRVGIEGPYGRMRSLKQFDSVIFFAGSTGATFTVPHMRHIVQSWLSSKDGCQHGNTRMDGLSRLKALNALTRRIRFVWVVKSRDHLDWFKGQLQQVIDDTNSCRRNRLEEDRQVEISIYVTCDEALLAEKDTPGNCCKPVAHGEPEEAETASTEKTTSQKKDAQNIEVRTLNSDERRPLGDGGCAPDGSCCCKAMAEDESDAPICNCLHETKATASSSSIIIPEPELYQHSSIAPNPPLKLVSGRPQPRSIIRKVLEEAEGESAVVVCGPQGLGDDIRASVVALSDERAVHKGTGAQGIYLHVEGFGY
jgi:predicted ferric reductase